MNHAQDEEDDQSADTDWSDEDAVPEATFGGCLADVSVFGVALLSMAGGILTSCLALSDLVQVVPQQLTQTLNLAAFPHSLSLLLRGFAWQALVAFGLFTFQLHRHVRAVIPGMLLVGLVAVLLLIIELTA